ncbi:MAG: sulfate permease [Myxococcales bacterium]|nr:sulfate permease [Myxococcales bacterium]
MVGLSLYLSPIVRANIAAGLTTAVMLVPQAMAYALLAGLPPSAGLYASIVPLLAYASLGTSRELAVGPVAMDSLLTAATVGSIAQSGSDRYIELSALLALMVGAIQMLLGLVRGGFLVNFLSRPVVSGFTSAAAFIIAASQLRLVLGLDLPRSSSIFTIIYHVLISIKSIHIPTVVLALGSLFTLWSLKRWYPRWPRALVVVVVGAMVAGPLGWADTGVLVVGEVPSGLPLPALPVLGYEDMIALLPGAVTIAFVAFLEGISISTKLADTTGFRVKPNREFLALGLANGASGIFGGYPVAGGLSRTAVNADAGASSKWAGVITAGVVALVLTFMTGLLSYVPKATLGAIILMAVLGLIDHREPWRLWRVKRSDGYVLVATMLATLGLGIQQGILVGVGLSLLLLVVRTTRPHSAVLGYLPRVGVYRNIDRFPEAQTQPGVLILRLDAQLYFGNVSFFRERLAQLEVESTEPLRAVVIDAKAINQLDSSAEDLLRELFESYKRRQIRFVLAGLIGPVRDVLGRSGLSARLGEDGVAWDVHHAMRILSEEGVDSNMGNESERGPKIEDTPYSKDPLS